MDAKSVKSMSHKVGDMMTCARKSDGKMTTFFYVKNELGHKRWMRTSDEKVFYLWYVLNKYKVILYVTGGDDDIRNAEEEAI